MHNKFLPKKRKGQALKSSLTTLAVSVMISGASLDAHALTLGEINVLSALGQPFRAEVDVTQLSEQEANGLKAAIASQAAYQTAGVEYNPVVASIRVSVQKRGNGGTFLRLTSANPIYEPYLGLVLDTNWASGRVVRDFTVLLDPPEVKRAEVTPTQISPAPQAQPTATSASAIPDSTNTRESTSERDARMSRALAQANKSPAPKSSPSNESAKTERPAPRQNTSQASGDQVSVKRGDTAGAIAAANLPANVSLDQMLVAMLRANPDAFIGGNVNRIRAGAVLTLPSADDATSMSASAARQSITAQSRDFNRYRQQAATNPSVVKQSSAAQIKGKVSQPPVVVPSEIKPDNQVKVTSPTNKKESQRVADIAKQAELNAQKTRDEELKRTAADIRKLSASAAPQPTPKKPDQASQSPAGGLDVPVKPPVPTLPPPPVVADNPVKPPAPPVPETASAAASSAIEPPIVTLPPLASEPPIVPAADVASDTQPITPIPEATPVASEVATPAPPPPRPRPVAPPPPPPEPSLMDSLMENPLLLGGGVGVLLLGGLGFLAMRKRSKKSGGSDDSHSDSEFIESRLQPDSFFHASGGQQVNTQEPRASTATSMAYSPSQLDAAGDVDPVAEADVYLAYGRDPQAEDILKEALRSTPERIAIFPNLLEVYAKRRDTKAFEELAKDLRKRTDGQGEDWIKVADLGNELDPGNPLYKSARDSLLSGSSGYPSDNPPVFGSSTLPSPDHLAALADSSKLDFELHGDSRLLNENESIKPLNQRRSGLAAFAAPPDTKQPESEDTREQPLAFDMDFDIPTPATAMASLPTQPGQLEEATAPVTLRPSIDANEGMLEFDMGALNADPDSRNHEAMDSIQPDDDNDPLATKLSLAREFHAIGDIEGARALVKEVIQAASDGAEKARAERFLAELQK